MGQCSSVQIHDVGEYEGLTCADIADSFSFRLVRAREDEESVTLETLKAVTHLIHSAKSLDLRPQFAREGYANE